MSRRSFQVLDQAHHWDDGTRAVVTARLQPPPAFAFFTSEEIATGQVLVNTLLDQHELPILAMIDQRLAHGQTDGWRYDDLPEDGAAWRLTLAWLEEDARERLGVPFRNLEGQPLLELVDSIRTCEVWHDVDAKHVWTLWTRYACTAYYSHPTAWDEIGFSGPAYPRGYKNMGIDKREHWERPR